MNQPIKLLITGDTYLGGGRVKELAINNSKERIFGEFLKKIRNADISITNLESPLIDDAKPISKTGPNLKSPIQSLKLLKSAGFNLLTLANNHIMDFGKEGLRSTLQACSKFGIGTVGAGKGLVESRQPFVWEIQGVRIAIINIAENEFGTTNDDSPGANALNPVQNYYQIRDIRKTVDYVILIIHGGHENYPLPSPRMKEIYRFFVDAGVSAVVGHHPHCYSGFEMYKNAPIFYSLGNFLFDKSNTVYSKWNMGFMVMFTISKEGLGFEIIPYVQNAENVGLRSLSKEEHSLFRENILQINKVIIDDQELEKRFEYFCESCRNQYSSYIEPYSIRYIHFLRNRNLFPSLLTKRKKRLLLNLTRCEAHRDVLMKILEQ